MRDMNSIRDSGIDRAFTTFNYIILTCFTLSVLLPLIFIVSASLSSPQAVTGGRVTLWPVEFSLQGYKTIFEYKRVWIGFGNSLLYTFVGTIFNLVLTIMAGYPLSRRDLVGRRIVIAMFLFTMLFDAGLIPTFLVVKNLGLLNTRAAMILPTGVGVFNLLITITYFRTTIPDELLDAARIDGCNDFRFLIAIVLPLSRPVIAVLVLFYAVNHWNSYFNALIYLKDQDLFPLQLVLREILIRNTVEPTLLNDVQELVAREGLRELLKYSLIIVASVPVLIIYPFVQRHFVKGMLLGSVK